MIVWILVSLFLSEEEQTECVLMLPLTLCGHIFTWKKPVQWGFWESWFLVTPGISVDLKKKYPNSEWIYNMAKNRKQVLSYIGLFRFNF